MNKLIKYFAMYAYILGVLIYLTQTEHSAVGTVFVAFAILMILLEYKEI